MASAYQDVISCCGCSGVPLLYDEPGSCKSEALKCGVAIFEAQSNLYNSLTTSSHLFDVLKQTTIPIAIDDINEKSQDTWEELIIDAYNNTPRGTRSYSSEIFCTLPLISANWRYSTRSRAFTRVIQIPFVEHSDEPNASTLCSTISSAFNHLQCRHTSMMKSFPRFLRCSLPHMCDSKPPTQGSCTSF